MHIASGRGARPMRYLIVRRDPAQISATEPAVEGAVVARYRGTTAVLCGASGIATKP
jgi:hypothetical protein